MEKLWDIGGVLTGSGEEKKQGGIFKYKGLWFFFYWGLKWHKYCYIYYWRFELALPPPTDWVFLQVAQSVVCQIDS